MPHWMQAVFIETLPKYIGIKKAEEDEISDRGSSTSGTCVYLLDLMLSLLSSSQEIGQFLDSSRRPSPYFLAVPIPVYGDEKRKTRGELNKVVEILFQ